MSTSCMRIGHIVATWASYGEALMLVHVTYSYRVVDLVTQIHVNHVSRARPARHKATLRHPWMSWELIAINRIGEPIASTVRLLHTVWRYYMVLLLLHLPEKV